MIQYLSTVSWRPISVPIFGIAFALFLGVSAPQAEPLKIKISPKSPLVCVYRGPTDLRIARADNKKLLNKKEWTIAALEKESKKTTSAYKKASSSAAKDLKKKLKEVKGLIKKLNACPVYNPPSASFSDVQPILQSKCMGCHISQGSWQNTEAWYLAAGRVMPGDPDSSIIVRYLKNSGFQPATMPKGLPALTQGEINTIRAWISNIGADSQASPPPTYSCESGQPPSATPLMRLSRGEYLNSVEQLLNIYPAGDKLAIMGELSSGFALIPPDSAQLTFLSEQVFSKLDARINQEHIDGYFRVAQAFGNSISSNPNRIRTFSGHDCLPGASGANLTCLRDIISEFGLRAFRRPLSSTEKDNLESFYLSRPVESALSELVTRILISPDFIYHLELNGTLSGYGSNILELTPYELAARLSFLFWESAPSDQLLAAAGNGSLTSDFDLVVNSIFLSGPGLARTKATLEQFFSGWLSLDRLPAINSGDTPAFATFASGENISVGGAGLRTDAYEEILDLIDYYVWQNNGTLDDLFLGNASLTTSAALAHLYGVEPSPSSNTPISLSLDRVGPLTRAALLISGNHLTNPAKRGARLMRDIMCQDLPDPDPATMGQVITPPYNSQQTTRQRFTDITAQPACVGCHAKINPIGFALESFDGLGRKRTAERVINSSGAVDAVLALNTHSIAQLLPGQFTEVQDGPDLIRNITDQGIVHACVAKKYLEFSMRRRAAPAQDGCMLETLRSALMNPATPLKNLFRILAENEHFRLHRIGP